MRQLRLHRLTQLRDVPAAVADRAFRPAALRRASVRPHADRHRAGARVDDASTTCARFTRRRSGPSVATLVAVGDCDHAAIHRLAARRVRRLAAGPPPTTSRGSRRRSPQPPRLSVVAAAGAPQSELRIGHVAVARKTPDYHALVAANMVLGGQFVSRINLNLREDKGFTYGARTAFDFRRLPGPVRAAGRACRRARPRSAIAESLGEISAIRGPRPITGRRAVARRRRR